MSIYLNAKEQPAGIDSIPPCRSVIAHAVNSTVINLPLEQGCQTKPDMRRTPNSPSYSSSNYHTSSDENDSSNTGKLPSYNTASSSSAPEGETAAAILKRKLKHTIAPNGHYGITGKAPRNQITPRPKVPRKRVRPPPRSELMPSTEHVNTQRDGNLSSPFNGNDNAYQTNHHLGTQQVRHSPSTKSSSDKHKLDATGFDDSLENETAPICEEIVGRRGATFAEAFTILDSQYPTPQRGRPSRETIRQREFIGKQEANLLHEMELLRRNSSPTSNSRDISLGLKLQPNEMENFAKGKNPFDISHDDGMFSDDYEDDLWKPSNPRYVPSSLQKKRFIQLSKQKKRGSRKKRKAPAQGLNSSNDGALKSKQGRKPGCSRKRRRVSSTGSVPSVHKLKLSDHKQYDDYDEINDFLETLSWESDEEPGIHAPRQALSSNLAILPRDDLHKITPKPKKTGKAPRKIAFEKNNIADEYKGDAQHDETSEVASRKKAAEKDDSANRHESNAQHDKTSKLAPQKVTLEKNENASEHEGDAQHDKMSEMVAQMQSLQAENEELRNKVSDLEEKLESESCRAHELDEALKVCVKPDEIATQKEYERMSGRVAELEEDAEERENERTYEADRFEALMAEKQAASRGFLTRIKELEDEIAKIREKSTQDEELAKQEAIRHQLSRVAELERTIEKKDAELIDMRCKNNTQNMDLMALHSTIQEMHSNDQACNKG